MQPDPEAFADMVVLTIKTALGPVLERLAAAEARLSVLGDLRDRVVTVETKADRPLALVPDPLIGEVRDRLLVLETKSAAAAPVDLSDVTRRLVALEGRPLTPDLADLRDRITTLETRSAGPSVTDMALVDVRERLGALERRVTDDTLSKELGTLRERVAVAEVRAPVPGPPGRDGVNGKDGADGFGFDDVEEVIEDEGRTVIHRYTKGEKVKEFAYKTAVEIYRGVYIEGKTYDRGDGVTWGGSEWHANDTTTTKPGDGSKAWTLKVKRGRDGKDGRDAPSLPVVSVGGVR